MGNKLMKHRMSRLQRAKQFMPFAALKGFEVLLAAVARPKENRVELSGSNRGIKPYYTILGGRGFCTSALLYRSLLYGISRDYRGDR